MMVLERGLTPKLFNEQMKMFNTAEKGDYASVIERMRQAYGLNYTQSAQLYKGWEQNKNTPGYFDSEAFARELEKYSEKPPENNSTELTMLSYVEDIKKYTYEIGQWHLDQKIPGIADALKNEWVNANKHGNTTDPVPGQHADPYPPEEPPQGEPLAPVSGQAPFNYETATPEQLREEAVNLQAQGNTGLGRSYEDEANNREELLIRDINAATRGSTRHLFSEHFGDKFNPFNILFGKNESKQMNAINETVSGALTSSDPAQFNAAQEFAETISRFGKDEKTGKPYNEANTFNSLADFSGDMIGLLNALRGITREIESSAERINKLEATLEIN
jgi:hypothetical protein